MMTLLNILAIIASGISILSTIWLVAFKLAGVMQKIDNLEKNGCIKLQVVDGKVTRLMVQMEPFWKVVETQIAQSLHHADTPEYDELLSKFQHGLNINELKALHQYLEQDLNYCKNNCDHNRILSVALVLGRVKTKILEGVLD